ncbi:E3 ubiquitin-protein ligase XIAP-like [Neocloeon triangulifer]|uniref:E3 ubiquitin-protein ligase XIAP-like n=1 Tax=Neocloeon triangulifer TaxID=2078957 RepID=UPI00286EC916|nr:E3 ubiquitin-protein ligase XIAP-like [Neocloeon triangulifer]
MEIFDRFIENTALKSGEISARLKFLTHKNESYGESTSSMRRKKPTRKPLAAKHVYPCDNAKLFYNIALHRLFTFPTNFEIDSRPLAEAGLFWDRDKEAIKCYFCKIETTDVNRFTGKTAGEVLKMKSTCGIGQKTSKNVPIGGTENYKFESHRLYSLLKKKDWNFVTPEDLAKSGFYYSGQEDNCRCIYCNLEVRGWEEGDTPDGEHKRWNPNCPFMNNPEAVVNIKIGQELTEQYCDSIGKNKIGIGSNPFKFESLEKYGSNIKMKSENPLVTAHDLNIHDYTSPKHPEKIFKSERLKTFKNWPKGLSQTPEVLANSGFYYTGSGDRVVCFHCNLGLKDWAPGDDPFTEHAKWNSGCQHLIMQKGTDFIRQILHEDKSKKNEQAMKTSTSSSNKLLCFNCNINRVAKVNLPCGHVNLCNECNANNCVDSSCSQQILGEITVFF